MTSVASKPSSTASQTTSGAKASIKDIALMVKDRIKLHNLPVVAAGIGFWGFLALIPFATAMIGLYSIVADPADIVQTVEDAELPESISGIILDPVEQSEDEAADAGEAGSDVGAIVGVAVSIALALWAASGGIKHLMASLNQSFDEEETRKFVPLRGTALGLTLGAILFLAITVFALTGLTPLLEEIGLGSAATLILQIIRFPILLALGVAAFSVLYKFGPDHKTARGSWTKGAIVALLVLIPAVILIGIFSVPITTGSFAALGGIALSMVTLLAMAAAVLIGGEWIRSEELLNGGGGASLATGGLAGGVPAASLQANQSLGGSVAGASGSSVSPNGSVSNVSPRGSVVNPNNVASGESPISPAQTKAMTMAAIAAAAVQSFRGKESAPADSDKAKKVKTKKAKPPKVKKAKVVKKTTVKEFESRRGQ